MRSKLSQNQVQATCGVHRADKQDAGGANRKQKTIVLAKMYVMCVCDQIICGGDNSQDVNRAS